MIRLQFADQAMLKVAERVFAGSTCNDEALALQVPSDGSVKSLRAVLDYLDLAAIDVAALSVHTPNLDDAFLALTGRPAEDRDDMRTETQKETAR